MSIILQFGNLPTLTMLKKLEVHHYKNSLGIHMEHLYGGLVENGRLSPSVYVLGMHFNSNFKHRLLSQLLS